MELKKLIKLQNAIIRAHQKIKDVENNNDNQTKEFQNEINVLTKTLEQLTEELNTYTKKEEVDKQSIELERLKSTLNELNKSVDKKISSIQLKHGKDGINGKDGKDGKDGMPGKPGKDGSPGRDGKDGNNGLSAYEIAVKQGFKGTEKEWIEHITNNGGKNYSGQIAAIRGKLNELENKSVPDDVLTQASILQTIEECEQCTGEQVPAASLMAMTYNSIPKAISEVENDAGYATEDWVEDQDYMPIDDFHEYMNFFHYTKDEVDEKLENLPSGGTEYKADDNIVIEDETIKGFTNTGYKVSDEDIQLQPITDGGTIGTNKQVYTDAEISVIYDGSNKIRRAVNGIDFKVIPLPYACKSMFYNPNIKRIYGLANGYFLYSDDNGETWNTKQSTYANGCNYITQAQPHVTGLTAVNKSTKTLYGLGDNFIQNSSIKSTISPDFVTQFSQYQFIWCNSSGTFKYGAGSQEGDFASLSGVTVNMLKTVNGRQIVGVKNSNKFYMIKNLSGVTGNEWVEYTLPDVCTVNDIIFNPYNETYYIFTDVNTYYKTKDLTNPDSFESVDKDGLRGVQGHFTLMGIQMTTTDHDKLLLAPTRTKIENKLQEHDRDLDKTRWVGKGLELTEEGKVNVKSNTDKIGVNDYGLYLGIIDQNNLSEDVIESLYVAKATIKPMSPYEFEEWYWGEGYPQDDNYACQKIVFTEAGSFIDQVNWEGETFVEEGELGYLFCDQNQTIFKYVKLCNLNWFK